MEQQLVNTFAALITFAIFSFLWKDNPFYKFAEHLVVGVSAGYWVIILYRTSLVPKLVDPLKRVFAGPSAGVGDVAGSIASVGTVAGQRAGIGDVLVFIPMILGLLLFTRFVPKVAWVSRITMAYILGIGSGAAIPLVLQTNVIQQIYPMMAMFLPGHTVGTWEWVTNFLVMGGVLCGLAYFFFSARHEGILGGMSRVGIWTLMIGFGASFGYTVMSRISLLYGRVDFLLNTWARPIVHSLFG
jgi:hypothetical protein